jgi:hypothetical protein
LAVASKKVEEYKNELDCTSFTKKTMKFVVERKDIEK